jgi:hypothetical protein
MLPIKCHSLDLLSGTHNDQRLRIHPSRFQIYDSQWIDFGVSPLGLFSQHMRFPSESLTLKGLFQILSFGVFPAAFVDSLRCSHFEQPTDQRSSSLQIDSCCSLLTNIGFEGVIIVCFKDLAIFWVSQNFILDLQYLELRSMVITIYDGLK